MRVIGILATSVVAIGLMLGIAFAINYFAYGNYWFFAPRVEAVRNRTFHQSQAYTDGMRNELTKAKYNFDMAKTDNDRAAICALVRSDFGSFDPINFEYEQKMFILTCNKYGGNQ